MIKIFFLFKYFSDRFNILDKYFPEDNSEPSPDRAAGKLKATFGPGAEYEYSDYLTNLHISWITISEFMGDDTTWVISYPEGEYYGVEYGGRDFTYLENYEF